jgi:spore maturation protein CgeB
LFEAAACAAPVVSDWWQGLDEFLVPDREILIARTTDDVLAALDLSDAEIDRIGEAARARALSNHTSGRRADELVALLSNTAGAASNRRSAAPMEA